jgi:hypothetical protein
MTTIETAARLTGYSDNSLPGGSAVDKQFSFRNISYPHRPGDIR